MTPCRKPHLPIGPAFDPHPSWASGGTPPSACRAPNCQKAKPHTPPKTWYDIDIWYMIFMYIFWYHHISHPSPFVARLEAFPACWTLASVVLHRSLACWFSPSNASNVAELQGRVSWKEHHGNLHKLPLSKGPTTPTGKIGVFFNKALMFATVVVLM